MVDANEYERDAQTAILWGRSRTLVTAMNGWMPEASRDHRAATPGLPADVRCGGGGHMMLIDHASEIVPGVAMRRGRDCVRFDAKLLWFRVTGRSLGCR